MIYWDNAATTWPKPMAVTEAMSRALTRYGANPGRGGHTMGMAASREVYRCRETAAEFFHLDNPGQVVFTLNCTMAMNMALKGILQADGWWSPTWSITPSCAPFTCCPQAGPFMTWPR